ncbi:MAG: FimV family protein [Betaproteobacteria bacterium]|nr:FimV family protein [Betaproteobacteria bacterium]
MKKSMKISGLVWALLLASGAANAAGLGKLTVQSALGQPLRAEIELLSVSKEELADLSAKLAGFEAYRQARIERGEVLNNLRFTVDQRANGQPVVRITSSANVADPFLDLLVELNWSSGRIVREYTVLLDPPTAAKPPQAVKAAAAAEPARPVEAKPQPAPEAPPKPKSVPQTEATAAPAPQRYGPVKSGETLRAIAGKVKPTEVSLEQMMVGLYQANKSAFSGDNMNRLKRGQVLSVPDAGTLTATSQRDAVRSIRAHVQDWQIYRRQLAEAAGAVAPADVPAATGKITPQTEARPAPPAAAQDVLSVSKGEPGTATGKADAKTQERLRALEEELLSKGRALQEANDRVGQLERSVRDLQKMLELKAQEAGKAPPPVATPAPVEPPAAPAEAPVAPAVASPAPAPVPVVVPQPAPADSPSWWSTFLGNPLYVGGLIAAVLLSGLLWMMMVGSRRKQGLNKFEDSIMTGGEFKNNVVFNPPAAAPPAGVATEGSMLLTDFSKLGMGAIDSHEVDPIAEAEVYMAYGRDAQAEEILKEALGKDPGRHEIALKLLEIYAARKDTVLFENTASELYAGLGGQNTPVWQRAAEMGRSIDPDNPLYRAGGMAEAPAALGAVGLAATEAGIAAASAEVAPAPADLSLDFVREPAAKAAEPDTSMPDLGWDSEPLTSLASEPEAAPAMEPFTEPLADLGAEIEAALPEPMPALESAEEAFAEAPLEDMMEALTAAPVEEESMPETVAETPNEEVPVLDLSGIDLDLQTAEAPAIEELAAAPEAAMDFEPAAQPDEAPAAEAEIEPQAAPAEGGIDPELREEVNTKLDLARAYLEMGDREGAREILQEVLNEGDADQKAEAGKLIAEAG